MWTKCGVTSWFCCVLLCNIVSLYFAQDHFDWAIGNTSVALCAIAYCTTSQIKGPELFRGYTDGFDVKHIVENKQYDVQVRLLFS